MPHSNPFVILPTPALFSSARVLPKQESQSAGALASRDPSPECCKPHPPQPGPHPESTPLSEVHESRVWNTQDRELWGLAYIIKRETEFVGFVSPKASNCGASMILSPTPQLTAMLDP